METAEFVNVLSLGVKNDGSEDISTIVNEATEHSALFFPKGIYKLSAPLHLKHSIRGDGYSRLNRPTHDNTWLVSEIENEDSTVGMIHVEAGCSLNIENISLSCNTQECGLVVVPCNQHNMILVDKVGIYNVKGRGVSVKGHSSRSMFLQNMTIWGSKDYPVPGVGIQIDTADNRFDNIEIMACRVGMLLERNFNYGSNLHIWTGPLAGKDNGSWWRGTRSLVLDSGAMFHVTNFYPDTSFYAIESRHGTCTCNISNLFYWEDNSTAGSPDYDGAFFKAAPGTRFHVSGGELYIPKKIDIHGRMESVYAPGGDISGVLLRTDTPVGAENLRKLTLDDAMPDYAIEYAETGWCKVAEIVTAQQTGFVEAQIICKHGACYDIKCYQTEQGRFEAAFTGANPLCESTPPLKIRKVNDSVYAVYFQKKNNDPENLRFVTRVMQPDFRPLHFGSLVNLDKSSRCYEVLTEL